MRLFIFDDDEVRDRVAGALTDVAVEVVGSDDFDLALQTCYGERFDLLLVAVGGRFLGLPLIEKLRGAGSTTPVILLAADTSRATMTAALKLGVSTMVMKPLDYAELRGRILKAAPQAIHHHAAARAPSSVVAPIAAPEPPVAAAPAHEVPVAALSPAPAAPAGPPAEAAEDEAATARDLLVVMSDRESVADLRPLLPAGVTAHCVWDPGSAVARCQATEYRLIIVDATFGHLHQIDAVGTLRELRPGVPIIAVYLKSKADRTDEAHRAGYGGFLNRPFEPAALHECLFQRIGWQELVRVQGNVLHPVAFPARSDKLERYFALVTARVTAEIDALASACDDTVVVDLGDLPLHSGLAPELVAEVEHQASARGLTLRVVAPAGLIALVKSAPGTRDFHAYASLAEAV